MKFVPNAVMIGFVNALAILIFTAQLEHFIGISTMTYVFVGITLILLYTLPRFIKVIPAPLIAIVALTSIAIFSGVNLKTVGDLGAITQAFPSFLFRMCPGRLKHYKLFFHTPYQWLL